MITSSSNPLFNNPYESQIQQLLQIEALKKQQLQNEQEGLQTQKKALSDIDSKLSSLNSLLTSFTDSTNEKLQPLTGSSTNPDAIEIVSTTGMQNPGNYSIEVSQLAKQDLVLSDAISQDGTDYNATGSGTFDITIGSDTAVSITVDTTGLNNQEALEAIADQVNDQLGEKVTASVFKLGDGTSRLSFKSAETGEANRISISNQQGDFSGLNLTNEYTLDQLNAQFTIDNVTFQRSSNLIDDAIKGFTFELNKETSGTEQLKVSRDVEEARTNIEDFINKFNEANDIIRNKTFLNGDTGDRGVLQEERSIRNLSYSLRQSASLPVSSLSGNEINSLSSIGIEIEQNGTMKIADSQALEEALSQQPQAVADLFAADDGIAASINTQIERAISNDTGSFKSIEEGLDRKINRLDDHIENEEEYLIRKEEQLRAEFTELNQIISQGEQQFNQIINFRSSWGF